MASNNSNLGYFDMVFSLSETVINKNFISLQKGKKVIDKKFQFLVSLDGKKFKTSNESDFNTEVEKWEKAKSNIGNSDYYLHFVANKIGPPFIKTIEKKQDELIYFLEIKEASLNFLTKESITIKDCKYAFRVRIGDISIQKNEVIVGEQLSQDVASLNPEDFTFKKLFLDFSNVNNNDYEPSESITFENQVDTKLHQLVLNAFSGYLKTKDQSYLIGYNAKRVAREEKRLHDRTTKSLFDPISLSYSTTHGASTRQNSFNFLMELNRKKHTEEQKKSLGKIKNSLVSERADDSTHGVLALNFEEFEAGYVSKLDKQVAAYFLSKHYKTLHPLQNSSTGIYQSEDGRTIFNIAKTYSFHHTNVTVDSNRDKHELIIRYTIDVDAQRVVYMDFNPFRESTFSKIASFFSPVPDLPTIPLNVELSTSRGVPLDRMQAPRPAELIFVIRCGANGKLQVETTYSPLAVTPVQSTFQEYNNAVSKIKSALDIDWYREYVDFMLSPVSNINQSVILDANNFTTNALDKLTEYLDIEGLKSTVVLPVQGVYKFKNIRMLDNHNIDSLMNAILFDITYQSKI